MREDGKPFKSGPDFETVRESYRKRQNGEFSETHAFVDPVLAAARTGASTGDAREVARGLDLAAVALGMPYGDKTDEIGWFLKLDAPAIQKQRLLTFMALAGEVLPIDLVVLGIDQLIADTEQYRWMLDDQEGWRLDAWLRLFTFHRQTGSCVSAL